jgi:hypothetical protein
MPTSLLPGDHWRGLFTLAILEGRILTRDAKQGAWAALDGAGDLAGGEGVHSPWKTR